MMRNDISLNEKISHLLNISFFIICEDFSHNETKPRTAIAAVRVCPAPSVRRG